MSDDVEFGYWPYDVSDAEDWGRRDIQSPPLGRHDDDDDDDDAYDRNSSSRFSLQLAAHTTQVSEPPRGYVKDGRAYSHTHDESLGKHLYQMFLSSDHCDVTLLVGTSKIKAHRQVLMANSDYFNAMFSSTCSEDRTGTISFQDNPYVTSNGLEAILEYAYTGSFQVTESTVREILEAANHFLMPDVTELCEMFVRDVPISEGNYVTVFEVARDFGIPYEKCLVFVETVELKLENFVVILDMTQASASAFLRDVLSFVLMDIPQISSSPVCHELLEVMDAGSLLAMVKQDEYCFFTDLPLIEFIMKWVERREDRAPVLADVMAEINLLCFDEDTLDTISNTKPIRDDEKCRNLVAAAKERLLDIITNATEGEDDLHIVSAVEKRLKFLDITNQTVFELHDVFSLSTRKSEVIPMNRFKPAARNSPLFKGSSVLAVGGTLFIASEPTMGTNKKWFSVCYIFDPRRSRWKELARLSSLIQYSSIQLSCVNGEVCAIDEDFCACLMQMYNFCTNEWRVVQGRTRRANTLFVKAAAINGHLYLLSQNKDTKWEFFSYNPDCELWQAKKTPFSDIRHGHIDQTSNLTPASPAGREYFDDHCSLVVGEDCLYLFPSQADTPNFFNVEIYSPSADEWTTLGISHSFHRISDLSVAPHAGKVYISARYIKFDSPRINWLKEPLSTDSDIFILDPEGESITFLTKTDFSHNFAMLNIPKESVDMLGTRERSSQNEQRPPVRSFHNVIQAVASVSISEFGYLK